jgi:hypothetical protein
MILTEGEMSGCKFVMFLNYLQTELLQLRHALGCGVSRKGVDSSNGPATTRRHL